MRFLAIYCYYYFPIVFASTIFHQPYPLPSPQHQLTFAYRDIYRNASQCAFYMSRHVIRPLIIVLVQIFSFWRNFVEETFHVVPHSWVIILHDDEPCRSMHKQHIANANINLLDFRPHMAKNLIGYKIASLRARAQSYYFLKPQCHFYFIQQSGLLILNAIIIMDYKQYLEQVKSEKPLSESIVKQICCKIKQIMAEQSNLIRISAPVCVIGDVHGQFYDVLKLFNIGGQVPDTKYLFIGDYVDRGYNSLQTILYLYILKIMYPDRIYLTRGNHQSRQISCLYGFQQEINRKYGHTAVWKVFNQSFDYLPLAAIIDDQIFCVHGGLSPDIHALDQIREINRVAQIPTQGPFADLMWSDPQQIQSWSQGHRGAGWLFGYRVVNQFNHHNGLKLIARAHQLAQEGYYEWFSKKNLVTVWSAPNYCYRCNNLASIMSVDADLNYKFTTFDADERSKNSTDYKTIIPYFL